MDNPYAPPSSSLVAAEPVKSIGVESRGVDAGQGWTWLTEAYGLVFKNPFIWFLNTFIFFLISMVLGLVPILGQLVAQVLGAIFVGGLILGCDAQARGGSLTVGHLFAGFKHAGRLALLGGVYTTIGASIFVATMTATIGWAGLQTMLGGKDPGGTLELMMDPITWIGFLLGMALVVPLIMAYWFAPALIVLAGVSPLSAMGKSFKACAKNIVPFLIYGVMGMLLVIVSLIPLGLGMVVTMPAIFASYYTTTRDVFATSG
jgi:hypothetical protein